MATSSIYKRVVIKGEPAVKALSEALQQAEDQQPKPVVLQKKVRELRGKDIKKFFGA